MPAAWPQEVFHRNMASEIETYVKGMAELRQRLGTVRAVLDGRIGTGNNTFDAELIFIQLRKALELIAFGSPCANRAQYSQVHRNFTQHWNAKRLLTDLEKVNPRFYPEPLHEPREMPDKTKHFDRPVDGFLTGDEFAQLYDSSAEVLHIRNPFRTGDPTIHIGYNVDQWVARIQRLLVWHVMHLTDGGVWVVMIPADGDVGLAGIGELVEFTWSSASSAIGDAHLGQFGDHRVPQIVEPQAMPVRAVAQRAPGRVPLPHRLGPIVAPPLAGGPEVMLGRGVPEQVGPFEHARYGFDCRA